MNDAVTLTSTDRSQAIRKPLPKALRVWMIVATSLTAINVTIELFCHFALRLRYPYDWPFVAPISRFDDLLDWLPQFHAIHTEAFFHQPLQVLYPAPMTVCYLPFFWMGRWALAGYIALAAAFVAIALLLLAKRMVAIGLKRRAVVEFLTVMLLTSYPFWFLIHTANLELIVWICTSAGLWALCRGKEGTAATLFGLAASMKFYPILLLALFLRRGSWTRILQALAVAATALLASLWIVYPNLAVSWQQMRAGSKVFLERDGLHWLSGQAGFDHTLFSFLKTILPTLSVAIIGKILVGYLLLAAAVVLWAWFARISHRPLLDRLLFLTILMLLLPPTSYDYTLVHLYAPWVLVVLAICRGVTLTQAGTVAMGCFAILFTAQGYIIASETHYSAQLKCLTLLCLAVLTVRAKGGLFTDGEAL